MTTTLTRPAAVPGLAPAPGSVRPARPTADAAVCPIELAALRAGARTLAEALTGIALDAPCDRERQRAVRDLTRLVLTGVGAAGDRLGDDAVRTAATRVRDALPTFAHDVSAGAPALATACAALADRLDAVAPHPHDHGGRVAPAACERRFRTGTGPARAVLPWFLDAASPAERVAVVRDAPVRVRWALRFGEDRYLRTLEAVRG